MDAQVYRPEPGTMMNDRRKAVRAELQGEYAGLWLSVWANAKTKLFNGLQNAATRDAAVAAFVLDHNLRADADGNLVPTGGAPVVNPLTEEAVGELAIDSYGLVVEAIGEAITAFSQLPKASVRVLTSGSSTSSNGDRAPDSRSE